MKKIVSLLLLLLAAYLGNAQDALSLAKVALAKADTTNALELLAKQFAQNTGDREVYEEYYALLMQVRKYNQAENVVQEFAKYHKNDIDVLIDETMVHVQMGKTKKANETFHGALLLINGDDNVIARIANKLDRLQQYEMEAKVYEKGIEIMRNPSLYAVPLGKVYAKLNRVDEAIQLMIQGVNMYYDKPEDLQANLLEVINDDPKRLQVAQKAVIKLINEQPDNVTYTVLLTWLYTQKGDWEGAYQQVRSLDLRFKEDGRRLVAFAQKASQEQQYDAGNIALDEVLKRGERSNIFWQAWVEKINIVWLKTKAQNKTDKVFLQQQLPAMYQAFEIFPELYNSNAVLQIAQLQALYMHQPDTAIAFLEKALKQNGLSKQLRGNIKLDMGDYLVLQGKVWDASLTYSQVDKEFREDMLGEEARFRNAKLAYYRGDFEWAQGQLDVLKSSTSELIANDALALSVLITENISADSNYTPIKRYAYADLLLFQNKDEEAVQLLDSISKAFPEHALNDDILMLKAKIELKHNQPENALRFLQQILDKHKDDVLADDALFKIGEVYEVYLKKPEVARKYYEQLIIDYHGSTYVQEARRRISAMSL